MKVLVGCEFSGIVRDAFIAAGHDAISCDLIPTESPGLHHQGDIIEFLEMGEQWDIGILHPDCRRMALCGNKSHAGSDEREFDVEWAKKLWRTAKKYCTAVCLENPASVIFNRLGVDAQYVQPWQFGHPETKKTGLALHLLPDLVPTKIVYEEMMALPPNERHRIFYMAPSETRGKDRSRFYSGFANAMAEQWTEETIGRFEQLPLNME